MNLNQLYYFRLLAQLKHYTRAAKQLYISQPSLSAAIASLEKELGVKLFEKQGRAVALSKNGRLFYDHVTKALDTLDEGLAVLDKGKRTIDIGCVPTLTADYLPRVIREFREGREDTVDFEVFMGMTDRVIKGVLDGTFDLGFCSHVEDQPDLHFLPVMPEQLVAVVPHGHALAERKVLALSEIAAYPLISYRPEIPIGKAIHQLFEKQGLVLTLRHAADNEMTIGGMVSQGFGIAVAAYTPMLMPFDLVFVPLDVPHDVRVVHLVYHSKAYQSKAAVQAFVNYISKL